MRRLKSIFIVAVMLIAVQNIMAQKALKMMEKIAKMPKVECDRTNLDNKNLQNVSIEDIPLRKGMSKQEFIDLLIENSNEMSTDDPEFNQEEYVRGIQGMSDEDFQQTLDFMVDAIVPIIDMQKGIEYQMLLDLSACSEKDRTKIKKKIMSLTKNGFSSLDSYASDEEKITAIGRGEDDVFDEIIFLTEDNATSSLYYASGKIDLKSLTEYFMSKSRYEDIEIEDIEVGDSEEEY
jgi:hypothetical protein